NGTVAAEVAWACVLVPDPADAAALVQLATVARDGDLADSLGWVVHALASVRAGKLDEALKEVTDALGSADPETAPLTAYSGWGGLVALIQAKRGKLDEAQRWLARALKEPGGDPGSNPNVAWDERLRWQTLRQETEGLLKGKAK